MSQRRMFESNQPYDVCFRAKQGFPLPQRRLTTLLILSLMARILTSNSVVVCNFVWMSNHAHMQLVCLDAADFASFYGRLKKGLTDFIKRLLAAPFLQQVQG